MILYKRSWDVLAEACKDLYDSGLSKKEDFKEEDADPKQLAMGIAVEKEHTDSEEAAKKITLDHLAEDPEYYTKLKKMESGE